MRWFKVKNNNLRLEQYVRFVGISPTKELLLCHKWIRNCWRF